MVRTAQAAICNVSASDMYYRFFARAKLFGTYVLIEDL